MGSLLAWLFLKTNGPHYNAFHGKEGKKKAGAKPPENFWDNFSSIKENALFDTKRALQKGHFHSFDEKSRGPDPQDPLDARLIIPFFTRHVIRIKWIMRVLEKIELSSISQRQSSSSTKVSGNFSFAAKIKQQ